MLGRVGRDVPIGIACGTCPRVRCGRETPAALLRQVGCRRAAGRLVLLLEHEKQLRKLHAALVKEACQAAQRASINAQLLRAAEEAAEKAAA